MVQKVKGISVESQQWIVGQLLQTNYGSYIIPLNVQEVLINGRDHIHWGDLRKVEPSTICRFTGFLDKYENDLYEFDWHIRMISTSASGPARPSASTPT